MCIYSHKLRATKKLAIYSHKLRATPCTDKRIHHTGNRKCKTQARQSNRFTFCHSEGSAHKLASLGLLPIARRARCLAPTARRLTSGCWPAPLRPRPGPKISSSWWRRIATIVLSTRSGVSAACWRFLRPAASSRCALHPSSLLPLPGFRERSRTGQRTLKPCRRVARALQGRLRLAKKSIWHGFSCRCTVSHALPMCGIFVLMQNGACTSMVAS